MKIESILNKECSATANAIGKSLITVNLLHWLTIPNPHEIKKQQAVRNVSAQKERDILKREMASLMTSGRFSARGKKHLLKHSGLLAVDIDRKDNLHICNFSTIKEQLSKLSCVAYCGVSVSGTGYWALIAIGSPDKHEEHFEFVRQFFESKGLIIDPSCKNVNRLRFYSFDPEGYFNHYAKPLVSYYTSPTKGPKVLPHRDYKSNDRPVWLQYNETNDFIDVLKKHGWNIDNIKGDKTFFVRPGKTSGVSAEFDRTWGSLYIFTSSGVPFEPQKNYSPFQVYATLEHRGDFKAAARTLSTVMPIAFRGSSQQALKIARTKSVSLDTPSSMMQSAINTRAIPRLAPAPFEWQNNKEDWSNTINDLQAFFDAVKITASPYILDQSTVLTDVRKFVETHLSTVKGNNGNSSFLPYLNRLLQFKNQQNENTNYEAIQ
jgi:hypothetical protein